MGIEEQRTIYIAIWIYLIGRFFYPILQRRSLHNNIYFIFSYQPVKSEKAV